MPAACFYHRHYLAAISMDVYGREQDRKENKITIWVVGKTQDQRATEGANISSAAGLGSQGERRQPTWGHARWARRQTPRGCRGTGGARERPGARPEEDALDERSPPGAGSGRGQVPAAPRAPAELRQRQLPLRCPPARARGPFKPM